MGQEYFEWGKFAVVQDNSVFPIDEMGEIFLLDVEKDTIWLSEKCGNLLYEKQEAPFMIKRGDLEQFLSDIGIHAFRQAIQRLQMGKAARSSCHAAIQVQSGTLSSVIYLYRLMGCEELLGHISVDYEPMREYEQHLEEIIKELNHAKTVNELIVEGSTDYIYQLDLVNNMCTFSSKALDVLPLESPTFGDAMNRVLSFIVPEDRQIFLESFTPFLSGQSDRHVAEYRVLTKQGNIMWISCNGKGVFDEQGRPMMIAGSLMDTTEQKKQQGNIQKMLYYDELTGLKNRRCFESDLEEYLKQPAVRGSFLYINIRKHKQYNELFGHDFGNKVLKEFAYMLNLYLYDAKGIYRFSDDEFLVHLKEYTKEQVMAKILPFQTVLKRTRELDGHVIRINTNTSVVLYPEHGNTIDDLLNNANQCLYRMIQDETQDIRFFAGENGNNASLQFRLENEIINDIEHNFRHFRVVYQPIVHVTEDGVEWLGAEALLRYSNSAFPELGQMDMIHTLEYTGAILPVGRWVISQALHECRKWNRFGKKCFVHVNVAAQQVSDVGLVEYIKEQCEKEFVAPCNLVVELTETSLLNNFEVATAFCENLISLGVGVALDDFGTGYSSFNYLRKLPITEIKIDREYTRQLQNKNYNQTFVSFMNQISKQMNLKLCVEGVETEEELKILCDMDISMIQGFYFERPMEAEVICREFPSKVSKE